MTIAEVEAVFRKWLHLPDLGALYALLGTVAANKLPGDPVWLLLVGPPGGGKTELLNTLSQLPNTHRAATITEAALLSGVPQKEHSKGAKGGLLREIGDFGIIVAKDFGSVLSMNRDARAALLAALREVYDGSWTRYVGADGGRMLHWEGKVGFVGGVTPTIDRHHAVMGSMGERFILYRLPEPNPEQQAWRALSHAGHEKEMRAELAAATTGLLQNAKPANVTLSKEDGYRLIAMATLTVKARSAIERDGYTRDIELIPEPEAPTRLIVVLRRLLEGLDSIGLDRCAAWKVIAKATLDSVPAIRLSCLRVLTGGTLDTNAIAGQIRYPASTTRRALEDLTAHNLAVCTPDPGKAHHWHLTEFAKDRLTYFPDLFQTGSEPHNQADSSSFPDLSYPFNEVRSRQEEDRGVEHFGKASSNGSGNADQPQSELPLTVTADDDIDFGP